MAEKTETAWAIVGRYGLYYGIFYARNDAITDHCHKFEGTDRWPTRRGLSKEQRRVWRMRKRRGDRAVKVRITYDD